MENKDQYNLDTEISNDSPLPSSINDLHTPPPDGVNGTALDAATNNVATRGWAHSWSHPSWPIIISLAALILVGGTVLLLHALSAKEQANLSQEIAGKYSEVQIPLEDLLEGKDLTLAGISNVTINGTLNLGKDLLLAPSLQPTGAKAGQIYYDQGTNELAYYNGENFVFLSAPSPANGGVQSLGGATGQITLGSGLSSTGGRLDNTGVLTVQGQSGDVAFTAGAGLVINGTTFSNSGVLGITAGSSNVSVNRDANGNVSISVEEPIAGTGTVTSSGGSAGSIPLFTASQNVEDSIITQAGLTISVAGSLQLDNALTVSNGGTGAVSLTANGILVGQGTGAVTSVAAGGSGLCLLSTAGAPVWGACPGGGGGVTSLNGLTGGLSIANASGVGSTITIDDATTSGKGIASFNSTNFSVTGGAVNTAQNINSGATPTFVGVNTNSITPSGALTVGISAQTALLQGSTTTITSNGAGNDIVMNSADTIELQDNTNVTGALTTSGDVAVNGGDITSSGALNITPGGALTIGSTSQALTLQGGATSSFRATSGANTTTVAFASPTANTTLNFPALSAGTYTICTTSGNCSGAAATLQSTYDNSSTPELVLDATRGALTIRDNASAIGANLLEVQNNAGSTTYFAVTASGVAVAGTATVTGNVNSSGGALQTNGTSRIDNSGNAVNLGNVTLSGAISGGTSVTGSGNINTTGGALQTNSTTRIDNSGNLINIAAITASGSATFQGGAVTLGTNAQAGSIVLNDGSSNTGTLQVAALGQNTVYTLPDPGAGTATICLTTGNCAGSGTGVTTAGGTTNRIPKFTGSQALGDSNISDNGTDVTVSVDVIIQGGDLTVGTASQAASVVMHDGNGQTTTLQAGNSSGNITFILPTNAGSADQCLKQSGTGNQLVWQDCDGGSGGSSATLQTAYANSSNPEIVLNSSVGGLTIRDSSTPLGTNLFEIQNNLGSTTYMAVTVSGLSVTGTATASGSVNSSSGTLQTNGTSRVDNSGNLVNIGNITGTGAVTVASVGAGNDITVNGADQFIVQDASVFNALSTFNANIDLGSNDIIGTTSDIDLTNFDVAGATGNVTAGTYNGQTISSSANFTGTVAVAGNTTLTGDIAVNGGDITSTGALNITPGGALTVGISAQTALLQGSTTTITSNGAGNDIVLNSADTIELQDNTNVTGNVSATGDIAVNGGDLTSSGALNITPGGTLTVGASTQTLTLQGGATTSFRATSGANTTIVAFASPTANTTLNFPALAAGTYTICTTSGNCSGAAATLQSTYDNSSTPEIVLDATRLGLTIRDNASAIGANLLEVQNNAGSTTYFAVTSAGATVTGTATASGNINSTGGALQTNGTSRIDNSGNLINIAAITASGSATFQGGSATLGTSSQAGSIVLSDGSSNTGTLQVAALGQDTVYTLPDPGTGTATICLNTGNCAGVGGTGNVLQGGNSFGAALTLGTNDSFAFNFETGGVTRMTIAANGSQLSLSSGMDLALQGASAYITNAQGQTNSEAFGQGATVGGANAVAVGSGAVAAANGVAVGRDAGVSSGGFGGPVSVGDSANAESWGVAVGQGSSTTGNNSIAIGNGATAAQEAIALGMNADAMLNGVALGYGATTDGNNRIVIGHNAIATADFQLVIGSDDTPVTDAYIGGGVSSATPQTTTIHATGGSGTDVAGADLNLAAGAGTGSAAGGNLNFQVATPGTSGASANVPATAFSLSGSNGAALFKNVANSATGFQVQNAGGAAAFTINTTTSNASFAGAVAVTGNINSTGGALQTNSTSRIDNSGNLVNIGNITGTGAMTIASTGAGNDITVNGADQFIVQDASVFNALTSFNANIDLGTNDLVGTTADIDLSNFDVAGATGNVTAGTYNGQTISSAASFTGTVTAATSLRAPLLDTASATALAIGTTNATAINLNQNTTLAAGKTLTVTSANTSLTGATTGDALTVSNSTSTGNVAVFNDNSTAVFTIANSGLITAKSQGTSTTAFDIQNSSSQSLFAVDTFNNTVHLRTVGRDNTSTYEAIWLQGSKNGITTLIGGNDDVSAYVANDFSGSLRFNGSGVGWGDMAYFPQGGGNGNNGHFRFSTSGSALNTTPNAKLGVGDLYVAGNAGIGTNSPSYKLHVAGDVNVSSGSVYRINGTTVCSGTTCTPASGSSSYIQNQSASQQSSSSFWTSGSGRVDGGVLTNNVTSNSGALTLQAATNVISLGGSDSLTANGGFNIFTGTNSSLSVNANGTGSLSLGSNATSGRVINIAATGTQANTSTTNIGTSTGAAQTINIGSTNGTGTTTISAGSGGVNVNGATSVSGQLSATSFTGAGLTDCDSSNSKLLWDTTTKQFSCGTDRATAQVRKSGDQTRTSTSSLTGATDSELTFAVDANSTYIFQVNLNVTMANAPNHGGFKYDFGHNVPSGATCNYSSHGMDTSGGASEVINGGCTTSGSYLNNEGAYFVQISGTVTTSATSGSITLRWAQNVSDTDATVVKAGSNLVAYKVNGADLAEAYYTKDMSVAPGDLVQLDSSLQAGVKKADSRYDPRTLGVITTKPGLVIGDDTISEGKPVLLALTGRVPIKVSAENGPIEAGDFLTSSSTPGVAMKATEPGYAIAQAMTGFAGEGTGSVLGFIKGGWYQPPPVAGADLQNSTISSGVIDSLSIEGPLTVTGDAVFQGKVAVKDIEITGHVTVSTDTAGTTIIPAGQTFADVTFKAPYATAPKVTATASGFVPVEITDKTANGFKIRIPEAKTEDVSVDWISLQLAE